MGEIKKAALIGGGVIGGGWAARLLWHGVDVTVCDPHPETERRLRDILADAEPALQRLYRSSNTLSGNLAFVTDIKSAVHGTDYIQESAPEREDLKRSLLAEIDAHCPPDALICTSTSGLLPTRLQKDMQRPERFMVGHPFNPVYLLPLVEICGGEKTQQIHMDRAAAFYASIGMKPLKLRKEIDGFIADRLMEALWREALWLVNDDVATVEEIDDAIRYGPGLRWAQMGTFQVYRLAGGEEGFRHFMAQFGPTLSLPWTKLMDVPEMTDALIDKMSDQSDDQARGASVRELATKRDANLIGIMHALQAQDFGAGALLNDNDNGATKGSRP